MRTDEAQKPGCGPGRRQRHARARPKPAPLGFCGVMRAKFLIVEVVDCADDRFTEEPTVDKGRDMDAAGGVIALVRQTVEGLADLVGEHLQLARLELRQDLLEVASRARLVVVLSLLIAVGYALAMAGLALALGGSRAAGLSLLSVGGLHVGIFGGAMFLALRRRGGAPLMNESSGELQRSLDVLGPGAPALRPAAADGEVG